jgi:hypothetical protein
MPSRRASPRPAFSGEAARIPRIYDGVSSRPRGWKTRRSSTLTATRESRLKRFDGLMGTSSQWDGLWRVRSTHTCSTLNVDRLLSDQQDPELFFGHGDCLIHLYPKGHSHLGPAFKVPMHQMLAAQCHPLIERFYIPLDDASMATWTEEQFWDNIKRQKVVELYIPPPPGSDATGSLSYHLATRNFLAWVFRQSLVGDDLGSAMVNLMHSMAEFRSLGAENVQDLLNYLEEQGYLEMADHPDYALAVLRLAETFQFEGLYIQAYAHCVGMNDRLHLSQEYQQLTSECRMLIRKGKVEMDTRLAIAGGMIRTFLEDDLSDAYLGLSRAERDHLDSFRTFLFGFYAGRFGYYPPPTQTRRTIYEPAIYRTMLADFDALYQYLVDRSYVLPDISPASAQGGICTLQSLEAFDIRHGYDRLAHPLPLLPIVAKPTPTAASTRAAKLTWLARPNKSRSDQKALAHAAIIQATNLFDEPPTNRLVLAYKKLEEDLVFATPLKADKSEKVSLVEGRKIRWILIYSALQTLHSCTSVPPELSNSRNAPYHLCISTDGLPPWKNNLELSKLLRRQTVLALASSDSRASTMTSSNWTDSNTSSITGTDEGTGERFLDLEPDINYLAIAQQQQAADDAAQFLARVDSLDAAKMKRMGSSTRLSSRGNSLRRSLTSFRAQRAVKRSPPGSLRQAKHHEIVVHGYGNGTNEVQLEESWSSDSFEAAKTRSDAAAGGLANRSDSTSSNSSTASKSTADSGMAKEPISSPRTEYSSLTWASQHSSQESLHGDDDATVCPGPVIPRRRSDRSLNHVYDTVMMLPPLGAQLASPTEPGRSPPLPPPRRRLPPGPMNHSLSSGTSTPPLPRRNSKRSSMIISAQKLDADGFLATPRPVSMTLPLRMSRSLSAPLLSGTAKSKQPARTVTEGLARRSTTSIPDDPDAWSEVLQSDSADEDGEDHENDEWEEDEEDDDIQPAWEQFADLGGLTMPGVSARYA